MEPLTAALTEALWRELMKSGYDKRFYNAHGDEHTRTDARGYAEALMRDKDVLATLDAARQPADPSGLREYERHPENKSPVETPRPFDSATARSAGGKQVPGGNRVPLTATPTEERLDAERLERAFVTVIDYRPMRVEVTYHYGDAIPVEFQRQAFLRDVAAEYARLASTEGERTLARPPRTYPCPSCGEVGDHSTGCTEGERTVLRPDLKVEDDPAHDFDGPDPFGESR
jgi:hypothetical protein